MQFRKYACNGFFSYESVNTSALDEHWRYRTWDDPVGKRLSREIGGAAQALQEKERELVRYLEDLDKSGALDNSAVRYVRMTDAIRANTAEGI